MPKDLRETTGEDGVKLWDYVWSPAPGESGDTKIPKKLTPSEFDALIAAHGPDMADVFSAWPEA